MSFVSEVKRHAAVLVACKEWGNVDWSTSKQGSNLDAWSEALAENKTIQVFRLNPLQQGDLKFDIQLPLFRALKRNSSIQTLDLGDMITNNEGVLALAEALKVNKTIRSVNFGMLSNLFDDIGVVALAEALKSNVALTSLTFPPGSVGPKGTLALAAALKVNTSITHLRVGGMGGSMKDMGLLALCDALTVNRTIVEIDAALQSHDCEETTAALRRAGKRIKCFPFPTSQTFGAALREWSVTSDRAVLVAFAAGPLSNLNHFPELIAFGAVVYALLNDLEATMRYLSRASLQSCYPVTYHLKSGGVLAMHIARYDGPGSEAARAARAVVSVVQGYDLVKAINVHLCGEGYAGKSMTKAALLKSMNSGSRLWLSYNLDEIPAEEGRTLGMVSEALECKSPGGVPIRALVHDYGGQEEFRANHAAELATPGSVYLLILPLWDKRPGPNQNKPCTLAYIVESYTNWLKFLNSVVPDLGQGREARCITALNFAKQFQAQGKGFTVEQLVQRLLQIQAKFAKKSSCRLLFVGEPILVNSNIPASVHKRLVPVLKQTIEELPCAPALVAPSVDLVVSDLAVPRKWPLFLPEEELLARICKILRAAYGRLLTEFTAEATKAAVVATIAEITQEILESRRDIVITALATGGRVSINHPNWLTEKLLGSLFDPRQRPSLTKAAPVRAQANGQNNSHLLGIKDIQKAVELHLDGTTLGLLDDRLIPSLLQHIGACIPVVVDRAGLVSHVATAEESKDVRHWFPAFSTTLMQDSECPLLPSADQVIARQYQLAEPEFCLFPPGYFSSLFVSIASLYKNATRVRIYKNGLELKLGTDTFQIVVRAQADGKSFLVTVASAGPGYERDAACNAMKTLRGFIFSVDSWRGNVDIDEFCVHPQDLLEAITFPIAELEARAASGSLHAEDALYFYGKQRVEAQGEIILKKLDAIASSQKVLHAQVDSLEAQVKALGYDVCEILHSLAGMLEESAEQAHATQITTQSDMCKLLDAATEGIRLEELNPEEKSVARAVSARIGGFLARSREQLSAAQTLNVSQLQQMKAEVVNEFAALAQNMHKAVVDKLEERERAQEATLQKLLQSLVSTEVAVLREQLTADHAQYTAVLERLVVQQESNAAPPIEILSAIARMRAELGIVRTVQHNTTFGVYDVPLLAIISYPKSSARGVKAALKGAMTAVKEVVYEQEARLHFACPVCATPAASGPKGKGYKLLATRAWVKKVNIALGYSLQALRLISLATPLPLPGVGMLSEYLPAGDISSLTEGLEAVHVVAGQLGGVNSHDVQAVSATSSAVAVQIDQDYVENIQRILLAVQESSPPRHTGLLRAHCQATGECAWVCGSLGPTSKGASTAESACMAAFEREGSLCQRVKLAFK